MASRTSDTPRKVHIPEGNPWHGESGTIYRTICGRAVRSEWTTRLNPQATCVTCVRGQ